jgi:hypothetical protein
MINDSLSPGAVKNSSQVQKHGTDHYPESMLYPRTQIPTCPAFRIDEQIMPTIRPQAQEAFNSAKSAVRL